MRGHKHATHKATLHACANGANCSRHIKMSNTNIHRHKMVTNKNALVMRGHKHATHKATLHACANGVGVNYCGRLTWRFVHPQTFGMIL
jgi:hypothetical protein